MVRKKNVLSMIALSFVAYAIVSLQWVIYGFSLAFGKNVFHGFIGNLCYFFLPNFYKMTWGSPPHTKINK